MHGCARGKGFGKIDIKLASKQRRVSRGRKQGRVLLFGRTEKRLRNRGIMGDDDGRAFLGTDLQRIMVNKIRIGILNQSHLFISIRLIRFF